jgi:hypothetical protein
MVSPTCLAVSIFFESDWASLADLMNKTNRRLNGKLLRLKGEAPRVRCRGWFGAKQTLTHRLHLLCD